MALKGSTGTYGELLFAQNGPGTACTGTTSAGSLLLASKASTTYPLPALEAGYFAASLGPTKAVRVIARGILAFVSAASLQTLSMGIYSSTADATASAAAWTGTTALAVSNTLTPATTTAASNLLWEMEVDLNLTAAGSAGTVQGMGLLTVASTAAATLPATGATPADSGVYGLSPTAGTPATTASFNTETTNYLGIGATWGASNSSASNTLTAYQVLVFALN